MQIWFSLVQKSNTRISYNTTTNFATYFGIKVASKPCFLAIALTTSRVKIKLSAALVQMEYFKTTSN